MNMAYNRDNITNQWERTDYAVNRITGNGSLHEGKLKLDPYIHHLNKNKKPTRIKALNVKVKN